MAAVLFWQLNMHPNLHLKFRTLFSTWTSTVDLPWKGLPIRDPTANCPAGSGCAILGPIPLYRTLPGWQRWLLALSDASRHRTCSDGCSPHRMLLETGRDQVGKDGCSPHRMLLGTGRYQVGSDGCSPYRMLLDTGRAAMDARPIGCF